MLWFANAVRLRLSARSFISFVFVFQFCMVLSAKEIVFKKTVNQNGFPLLPQEILEKGNSNKKKSDGLSSQMDTLISQDWGLASIGFFDSFTPLIQPAKSSTHVCSKEVVVAVVDTGIDYTHADLKDNVWANNGETGSWAPSKGSLVRDCRDKSCNGIDDDGNGFIDDVVGWDFVNNQALPFDTHGHGTHISGIIAAQSANGFGATGVCPKASIMALKYYDNSGAGFNNLQNTVKAIQYAVRMGAHIINYSGGGADPAGSERLAIEEAHKNGVLFVAAAGNDGHNNALIPYYPASYSLDNIIGVASINQKNQLLSSSNYGTTVHVAAPGLSILSTLPGGKFGTMSGTSQATAFVTGAAALLVSQELNQAGNKGTFDYKQIKSWLLEGAKPLPGNERSSLVLAGMLSIPGSLAQVKTEQSLKGPAELALIPKSSNKNKKLQ